jgi:hypothetical protein
VPADADVAVEQQRAAPRTGAEYVGEDRSVDRLGAATAGDADRRRSDVHTDGLAAGAHQREYVATGAAADVEDGRDRARQHVLVGRRRGAEPALKLQRSRAPVLVAREQPWLEAGETAGVELGYSDRGHMSPAKRRRLRPCERRRRRLATVRLSTRLKWRPTHHSSRLDRYMGAGPFLPHPR